MHRALGVQDAVEHRHAKRAAVMELAVVIFPASVAMRIDVHHAHRLVTPERFHDRIGNRMIAAHREGPYAGVFHRVEVRLDVAHRFIERVTVDRAVTDIGISKVHLGCKASAVVIGADAFDITNGPGPQPRPCPV